MRIRGLSFFLGCLLSLNSCGGGGGISILPSSDEFSQYDELNPKMDILWVVDNSNSMRDEIENVVNNIEAFLEVYIDQDYDFRMGVVSSSAWSIESYQEFKDWQECLNAPETSDPSQCDGIKPHNGEDRSYLVHPLDNELVFGRLHTGECMSESTGVPYISNTTQNISQVFSSNFNVYGPEAPNNLSHEGNCGTNPPADYSPTYHPVTELYYPFIHHYYYGTENLPDHYGADKRSRLFAYVGDERPLQSMRGFLLSDQAQSFLRPEAFLAVILITDEEDHSRPNLYAQNGQSGSGDVVTDYIDPIRAFKGNDELFKAYAITRNNFTRLKAAAENTGGFQLDITADLNGYLDHLLDITTNIVESSTNFPLNCVPDLNANFSIKHYEPPYTSYIEVPKASESEDGQGWQYVGDAHAGGNPGIIIFTEEYFPQSGTKIYIDYTPLQLGCNTQTGEQE